MRQTSTPRILPVIILALGVVALLRVGNVVFGFSSATAQPIDLATGAPEASEEMSTAMTAVGPANETGRQGVEAPEIQSGEVERRILEKLASRRAVLDAREGAMNTREAVLAAAEKKLEDRFAAFEIEREQLLALREEKDADEAEEIEALVSAYERMKPKDAAAIFNALDEDILVPVAAGMRTQALSGVLAEMTPENARKLTILLAERNQIDPAAESDSATGPRVVE